MGPLAIGAVTLLSIGLGTVAIKLYKRRNIRLLREARRRKYAPDLPPLTNINTTTTIIANENCQQRNSPSSEQNKSRNCLKMSSRKWQDRDMNVTRIY